MAEFTKGQEVFVPWTGAVYVITEVQPDGELWCSRGVHGWQHDNIRINPAAQQVIPLAHVLAAPAMLEALKEIARREPKDMLADCAYNMPTKKWIKEMAPKYDEYNGWIKAVQKIAKAAIALAEESGEEDS